MTIRLQDNKMGNTRIIKNTRPSNDKPNNFVFIIGAMKSGTTSLFDILSQHPQVCPSKTKEPDYFTKDSNENTHMKITYLCGIGKKTHTLLRSSHQYPTQKHHMLQECLTELMALN